MQRKIRKSRFGPADELRALLSGGDRRSIARSAQVSRIIHKRPARVVELARLTANSD